MSVAGVDVTGVVMGGRRTDTMDCGMTVSGMAVSNFSMPPSSSIAEGVISGEDHCDWYDHGWCGHGTYW